MLLMLLLREVVTVCLDFFNLTWVGQSNAWALEFKSSKVATKFNKEHEYVTTPYFQTDPHTRINSTWLSSIQLTYIGLQKPCITDLLLRDG